MLSREVFIDRAVAITIFIYWLLYENYIAFYSNEFGGLFHLLVLLTKMILPFILFSYSGLSLTVLNNNRISTYLGIFALFLIWLGLITLLFGDLFEWFKLLPRYIYFLAIVTIFYKNNSVYVYVIKLLVSYVLLAFALYIIAYLLGGYTEVVDIAGLDTAGIKGFYTNITSRMYFPGVSLPIVRLTGYWNEPSNASGTAFAAFFLCKYMSIVSGNAVWKRFSTLCLITGFLCFSNAGYIALAVAYLAGVFWKRKARSKRSTLDFILSISMISLIVVAFIGRIIVNEYNITNIWIRAFVGARDLNSLDVYGGRFEILENTIGFLKHSPWGYGLGPIDLGSNKLLSASALIYWMFIGGLPALVLLISREILLILSMRYILPFRKENLFLVQALIVVIMQHLSYGSWMNPNYFILVALVLSKSIYKKR